LAVLDSLLEVMRPRGAVVGTSWMRAPWGIEFDRTPYVRFNIVLDGHCWVRSSHLERPVKLTKHDLVLVLPDSAHALASSPTARAVPITELMPRLREQWQRDGFPRRVRSGDGLVLHGAYHFEPTVLSALRGLPRILPFRAAPRRDSTPLAAIVAMLAAELERPAAGKQVAIDRLVDLLLVYSLREWSTSNHASTAAWVVAMRFPALGRVLAAMHGMPHHPWTVAELAREAGMSRSAFAAVFATALGRPPLAYLTEWRMTVAMDLLRDSKLSVEQVAIKCGYGNAFAFSSAFKRTVGSPPSAHRRR
jgi:AraC family transcriptional activator of mtrCDE